jgi:hypothetical protein
MSEITIPVRPECGKTIVGGKPVPGSDTLHGIFHSDCKAKLQNPATHETAAGA